MSRDERFEKAYRAVAAKVGCAALQADGSCLALRQDMPCDCREAAEVVLAIADEAAAEASADGISS